MDYIGSNIPKILRRLVALPDVGMYDYKELLVLWVLRTVHIMLITS